MSRGWFWAVGCSASFLLAGCLHAPVLWSPDGQWVAYTVAVRSGGPTLPEGWLFATAAPPGNVLEAGRPAGGGASGYRLWATRVESGESVLLEESRGPLTSPSWSPDGKALAFGRLVAEGDGKARFEVVLQDGPARQRVLMSRTFHDLSARAAELPGLSLAWSPDSRYLAIPLAQHTLDLAIIRADNGRVLKVIEDAYLPSWSPDGTRLAFVRGGDAEALYCLDNNFGPPRHLADVGPISQAPVWSRDSQSILVASRPASPRRGGDPSPQVDLNRVRPETGAVEKVLTLVDELCDPEASFLGASFTFDRDGENLFYAVDVAGQPTQIVWSRPRNKEIVKPFHPVDFTIPVGALALSPTDRALALRVGAPGFWAPPGVVDLTSDKLAFTPLVPDDSARVEWVVTLVDAARLVLHGALPTATVRGEAVERATLLPIPGELASQQEVVFRLRRLGKIGRPLCDRPDRAAPADPSVQRLLDEARLFFDYLRQDYGAALSSLEALEAGTTDPDRRLRLLSVRAQIALAQGHGEQAKDTIAYLLARRQGPALVVEDTPAGPSLTAASDPRQSWPDYLRQRAEDYQARPPRSEEEVEGQPGPFGRPNLIAPAAPIEPAPAVPIPFGPAPPAPPRLEVIPEIELRPEVDFVAPPGGRPAGLKK